MAGKKRSSSVPLSLSKRLKLTEPPSSPLKPLDQTTTLKPFESFKPKSFTPTIAPDISSDPWTLLERWIPFWLVENWVLWTNEKRNALQTPGLRQSFWTPTFTEEVYLLLAILIYMGIHREQEIQDYWRTDPLAPKHVFTRLISRDRFLLLLRNICLCDPALPSTIVWNKFESWNKHMQDISMTLWRPGSEVAVDEAMIPFDGRSKEIVHMPKKPITVGYKVWVVAQQGYFLQWIWHEKGNGPVELPPQVYHDKSLAPTQAVVAHLLSKLPSPPSPDHGYHVFADNLFVTVSLLQLLRERGIAGTGTTRVNGGINQKFVALKKEDDSKDRFIWNTTFLRPTKDGLVMQLAWKDNSLVLLLSTFFDGLEEAVLRLRRCPSKSSSSAKTARAPFNGEPTAELYIPQIIDDYNHFMGGIDEGDQMRASYNWDRRTRRGGWRAIAFLFLFEVCVVNSFQLWRRQPGNEKKTYLEFRRLLYTTFFLKYS